MEKCKVIVEKGVMYLTMNGEKVHGQVNMKLEDFSDGTMPVANVSFIVDIEESVSKEIHDKNKEINEYSSLVRRLKNI